MILVEHLAFDAPVFPYISLFARIPFNGKRVALNRTIGIDVSIDF